MNQNNISRIIKSFTGVNQVYEFGSLSKSNNESSSTSLKEFNSFNVPVLELYQYEIKNHTEDRFLFNPIEYQSLSDSENEDKCSVYSFTDEGEEETNISSCDILANGPKKKENYQ